MAYQKAIGQMARDWAGRGGKKPMKKAVSGAASRYAKRGKTTGIKKRAGSKLGSIAATMGGMLR